MPPDVTAILVPPVYMLWDQRIAPAGVRYLLAANTIALIAGIHASGPAIAAAWLLVGILVAGWSGAVFGFTRTRNLPSHLDSAARVFGALVVAAWLLFLAVIAWQPGVSRLAPMVILGASVVLLVAGAKLGRRQIR